MLLPVNWVRLASPYFSRIARCPGAPRLPPLAGAELESYVIELGFSGVEDRRERECFLALPTRFVLPPHQARALIEVAGELLDGHPTFQRLLRELNVPPESATSPPRAARCAAAGP